MTLGTTVNKAIKLFYNNANKSTFQKTPYIIL